MSCCHLTKVRLIYYSVKPIEQRETGRQRYREALVLELWYNVAIVTKFVVVFFNCIPVQYGAGFLYILKHIFLPYSVPKSLDTHISSGLILNLRRYLVSNKISIVTQFSTSLKIVPQPAMSQSLDTNEIKKVSKICLYLLKSNLLLKWVNLFKYIPRGFKKVLTGLPLYLLKKNDEEDLS